MIALLPLRLPQHTRPEPLWILLVLYVQRESGLPIKPAVGKVGIEIASQHGMHCSLNPDCHHWIETGNIGTANSVIGMQRCTSNHRDRSDASFSPSLMLNTCIAYPMGMTWWRMTRPMATTACAFSCSWGICCFTSIENSNFTSLWQVLSSTPALNWRIYHCVAGPTEEKLCHVFE